MGITASRQLAGYLLHICQEHDSGGTLKFTSSQEQNILTLLDDLWKSSPASLKGQIQKRITSTKRNRLGRGSSSETKVVLSNAVESQLALWTSNPEKALQPVAISQELPDNYVISLCQHLRGLSDTDDVLKVQRRLACVSLLRLRDELGGDDMAILQYLSHIKYSIKKADIREWCRIGSRYDSLASDLGGDEALFVLPEDIPKNVWERTLNKTGDFRADFIKRVLERIREELPKCREASSAINKYQLAAVKAWKSEHFLTWQKAFEQLLPQHQTTKRKGTDRSSVPDLATINLRSSRSSQHNAASHVEGGGNPTASGSTEVDLFRSDSRSLSPPSEGTPWTLPLVNALFFNPFEGSRSMNGMVVGVPRSNPTESGQSTPQPRQQPHRSDLEQVLGSAAQRPGWLQESATVRALPNLRNTSGPNQTPNASHSSQVFDDRPTVEPCPEKRTDSDYNCDAKRRKRSEATEPPTPPPETDALSVDCSQPSSPPAPIQTGAHLQYEEDQALVNLQTDQQPSASFFADSSTRPALTGIMGRQTHVSLATWQVAQETGREELGIAANHGGISSVESQVMAYEAFVATADRNVMLGNPVLQNWDQEETEMDEFIGANNYLRL
ncbi:hypothetical protein PG987_004248 [Apiospora arundinis]